MTAIKREVVIGDCRLILGDCVDVLPLLDKVDAVVTDPPFEEEAHTLQRRINRGRSRNGPDDKIINEPLGFDALDENLRYQTALWCSYLSKGWIIIFCQAEAVQIWRETLESNGATYKRAMVWIKPDGMPQYSGDRPAMGYESIVAAWGSKGKSSWNGGGRHGVFNYSKSCESRWGHPTQKPLSLMKELIRLFSNVGETVLDPFMGSCSTGAACVKLGRKFIGIEKNEAHFETCCRRITESYAQPDLFLAPPVPMKQETLL